MMLKTLCFMLPVAAAAAALPTVAHAQPYSYYGYGPAYYGRYYDPYRYYPAPRAVYVPPPVYLAPPVSYAIPPYPPRRPAVHRAVIRHLAAPAACSPAVPAAASAIPTPAPAPAVPRNQVFPPETFEPRAPGN